jgi:Holliday junction resolvase RusA-like endonuclease
MKITIYGRPVSQGSLIRTRWSMRDANGATLHPWRDNVRSAAVNALILDQIVGQPDVSFGHDPVAVQITFTFARPASHFGTGRNAAFVKASAPRFPSSHAVGDIDKLARACLDALTDAGTFADDSQVVSLHARKVWVGDPTGLDRPGAVIDINAADIRSASWAAEVKAMARGVS